jgi:hypothetical protein
MKHGAMIIEFQDPVFKELCNSLEQLFGKAGIFSEQPLGEVLERFARLKMENINEHEGIKLIYIVESLFQGKYPAFVIYIFCISYMLESEL